MGWRSDEEIRRYYQHCRAFLFPGEEDFGITPLEAQACGRPVIAYGKGGVLETVTLQTGVFFDEQTAGGLMEAIGEFEAKERRFDAAAIREQAGRFSWERFSLEMAKVVGGVVNAERRTQNVER